MLYYVLKMLDDNVESLGGPYEGKCTLYNGLLWYATSLSPPTKFNLESAKSAIKDSKRVFKNAKFRLEEVIKNAA